MKMVERKEVRYFCIEEEYKIGFSLKYKEQKKIMIKFIINMRKLVLDINVCICVCVYSKL